MPIMSCVNPSRHPDTPESTRNSSQQCQVGDLGGEIPPEIGNLTNLTYLHLGENQLSGKIPAEIGSLTNLTELYLNNNQLSGEIPSEIGGLTKLFLLQLGGNQLSGEILAEIGNLTDLIFLLIRGSRFGGTLPDSVTKLSAMKDLRFDDNAGLCAPANEFFQEWLDRLPSRRGDDCPPAPVSGDRAALAALYHATDGPNWRNNTNWLTDQPLDTWYGVTTDDSGRVTELSLRDNRLNGTIPPEIGSLSNLSVLALGANRLSGEIPSEIGSLTNLKLLGLGGNELSGAIPDELAGLSNLTELNLWGNHLSGEIPHELDRLSNLRSLALGHNRLSGQIPQELANLSILSVLELDDNQLSGPLPRSLTRLSALNRLSFHNNPGLCAPADVAFQRWLNGRPNWSGEVCQPAAAAPTPTVTATPTPTATVAPVPAPTNTPVAASTPTPPTEDSDIGDSSGGCNLRAGGSAFIGAGDIALMALPLLGLMGLAFRRRWRPGRPVDWSDRRRVDCR